jgi:Tol biopolymer transport system component
MDTEIHVLCRNPLRLASLLLLAFLVVVLMGNSNLSAQKLPLSVDDLTSLASGGVPEQRLLELVKERGINFLPTAETLAKLKAGGVSDPVLKEISTQTPRGPDVYLRDGDRLLEEGKYDQAIARYRKILDLVPDDPGAKARIAKAEEAKKKAAEEAQRREAEAKERQKQAEEEARQREHVAKERANLPYYREQFRAAMQSGDCDGAAPYGNKILAVAPDDAEVKKAFADCGLKQHREQMRAALHRSDWQAALASANKILALAPGDDEAQKTVKDCNLAVSRQAVSEALQKGDCDAALSGAQKFFMLVPNDAQVTRAIEWCSTQRFVLKQTMDGGGPLAFSPDGRVLVGITKKTCSGNDTGATLTMWDAATGAVKQSLAAQGFVNSLAFSPDGRLLALATGQAWCGGAHDVQIWDVASGKLKRMLEGHSDVVQGVAFSPDGRLLASGSSDKTVMLWDVASGKLKRTLTGFGEYVTSVAFSPDGHLLASGDLNRTVKLWEMPSCTLRQALQGHNTVEHMAFSSDGRTLAEGGQGITVEVWDVASGTLKQSLDDPHWVHSMAYSPDGRLLIEGDEDKTFKVWDAATGALRQTLSGQGGAVWSVVFSPDGRWLVSASDKIKFWERVPAAR